jgi:hypothetical protein
MQMVVMIIYSLKKTMRHYLPSNKSFQDYIVNPLNLVPWFEVSDKCIQLILVLVLLVIFKFHHDSMNKNISSWKFSKFVQHIIITNLWNPSNHIATSFQLQLQLFEFHLHIYKSLARLVNCQMQLE